jgi:hypothetical protein
MNNVHIILDDKPKILGTLKVAAYMLKELASTVCKFEPPFFLKEIGSVLYLHASLVLNFLVSLLNKILNTKILLASTKTLANSETCTESRIASEFFSGSLPLVGFLHVITSH